MTTGHLTKHSRLFLAAIPSYTDEQVHNILLIRCGEGVGNVDLLVHYRMADHAIPFSDRGGEQAIRAGRGSADLIDIGSGEPLRRARSLFRSGTRPGMK